MLAFRGALSRFLAADGLFLSAGLAFFFLVTLIPIILLAVAMLGFVLTSEQAADEVVGHLTRNFPVYRREVRSVILRVIETRATSGAIGTIVLIAFATPLFGACRLVLHRMLAVRAGASGLGFVGNLLRDAGMVLALGALLFGATVVTWFFDWLQLLVFEPVDVRRRGPNPVNIGFSVTLSAAMFYLGYRYLPRRRVRATAAAVGAVIASLLWEVAKQLFALYIRNLGVYDHMYGSLGALVAFVTFVYYSAIVFVFGAACMAALESRRG